ncbi:PREDICTED: APC membrane recruitment protein 1, partial [Charadrius vociferus]|uniref:APC membrane recruitment protein 1 n=1 Tax=Charadrius vociferus TaxID=50402 RepID=UPI0005213704
SFEAVRFPVGGEKRPLVALPPLPVRRTGTTALLASPRSGGDALLAGAESPEELRVAEGALEEIDGMKAAQSDVGEDIRAMQEVHGLAEAVACAEFDQGGVLLAFQPDFLDTDPPGLHSGDLLSLILGDVTSLKSFDSLTGCGDDIAEPDVAESSMAVERSRDAAKRGSCLVTYQGGGEEMAVPEEAEEDLRQLWSGSAAGDGSYGAPVSSGGLETRASREAGEPPYAGDALDGVDLLTPQSDQQESAPNSDEGYYDSTTPGLEDEGGDGLGELKKDRLPRDSYSGDALYEFDALLSPSHGEESLLESKVSRPGIFSYFLDFCLPAEQSLMQLLDEKRGPMETEEERLAAIQKELLYWELRREPVPRGLDVGGKEKRAREKQRGECKARAGSSIGRNPSGLGGEAVASHAPHRGVPGGVSVAGAENAEWGDFAGTLCPENGCNGQRAPGSCLVQLRKSDPGFDSEPDCGLFGGSIPGSAFTQNLPALPTMVTFDIVDVEQEGEGECERHPELNAGEDIAEAFEDGYGRKESLAECEEGLCAGSPPGR